MRNLFFIFFLMSGINSFGQNQEKLIRIAEIVLDSNFVTAYHQLLQEEARASVLLEPGVEAIVPMFDKNNPSKVTILEIYSNKTAYEAHLKTPHFIKYKTETLKMIKSLKLIDMTSIDPESLSIIFSKTKL